MPFWMPFFSFLAAVLVLIPLPGHWRARNIPTLCVIAWLFLVNCAHGVNTIAWADNTEIKWVVWCDIVIRLDVGANFALPAACFRLCMHLERVASIRHVTTAVADKRRRILLDIIICGVLPAVYMALFYIVQGHRFDIIEGFGCHAEDYVSIPEFFLVWFPPIVFSLGTFIFAGLAFTHFFRRRAMFAKHLTSSNAGLTPSRYFRLMSMSLVQMFWALLLIALTLSFNYAHGLRPWTNWADVHSNFSRIGRFPAILIPAHSLRWTYFLWWSTPISACLFVLFFAFGSDATRDYYACWAWLRCKISGRAAQSPGAVVMLSAPSVLPVSSLPLYTPRETSSSKFKDSKRLVSLPPSSSDLTTETYLTSVSLYDKVSLAESGLASLDSHFTSNDAPFSLPVDTSTNPSPLPSSSTPNFTPILSTSPHCR